MGHITLVCHLKTLHMRSIPSGLDYGTKETLTTRSTHAVLCTESGSANERKPVICQLDDALKTHREYPLSRGVAIAATRAAHCRSQKARSEILLAAGTAELSSAPFDRAATASHKIVQDDGPASLR